MVRQDPTLTGLRRITERLSIAKLELARLNRNQASQELWKLDRLVSTLRDARRHLSLDLLRDEADPEDVMLAAGANWLVMAQWCRADHAPSLSSWHFIELRAEEARARRLTEKRRTERHLDLTYAHKVEHLNDLKKEYKALEGRACVPFTNESSDEIDELQALLDDWFTVVPEVWSEAEFMAAHEQGVALEAGTARTELPDLEVDEDEDFDFDPDDLF